MCLKWAHMVFIAGFLKNQFPVAFNKLKFPLDNLDKDKALKNLQDLEYKQITVFFNVSSKDPSQKYLSKYTLE